jgi:hypothetical protein
LLKLNIIFITYINRSGSTYLANLLSKYDGVLVCPEADILINKFLVDPSIPFNFNADEKKSIENIIRFDNKLKFWNFSVQEMEVLINAKCNFEAFLNILIIYKNKIKPDANTIVFKGDILIFFFNKFIKFVSAELNIQFISVFRDIRAVYNSQNITRGSNNKNLSNNPVKTSVLWNDYMKLSEALSCEEKFHPVKYEDLINNSKEVFKQLIGIFDIDLTKINPSGDLFRRIPDHLKFMHFRINDTPDQKRISAWVNNLSKVDVFLIEKTSGKILSQKGYKLINLKLNYFCFFVAAIYYYSDYYLKFLYNKFRNQLTY